MGFRLPLDALPCIPDSEFDSRHERNPFEPVSPLRSPYDEVARRYTRMVEPAQAPQRFRERGSAPADLGARYSRLPPFDDFDQAQRPQLAMSEDLPADLIRTALCIEPRDGRLYAFLPPLTHLEHWLDLGCSIFHRKAANRSCSFDVGYEGTAAACEHGRSKMALDPLVDIDAAHQCHRSGLQPGS